jgi:hypothetical protein
MTYNGAGHGTITIGNALAGSAGRCLGRGGIHYINAYDTTHDITLFGCAEVEDNRFFECEFFCGLLHFDKVFCVLKMSYARISEAGEICYRGVCEIV